MKIKNIFRLLLFLLAFIADGFLIKLGFSYKDNFYYVLAAIVFFILSISLIKKEKLPQFDISTIWLKINLPAYSKKLRKKKSFKQKKNYSIKNILKGVTLCRFIGLLIISISLSYLIIYQLPNSILGENFVVSLVKSFITYFRDHTIIIILLYSIFIIYNFVTSLRFNTEKKVIRTLMSSFITSLLETVIGIPISLVFVFIYILIFCNSLIVISNYNPNLLDIHTDKNDIKQIIDKSDANFEIVGITGSSSKTFVINSTILGRKGNYFIKNVIPSIPNYVFINSHTTNRPIYLTGNIFVIKELDKEIFQTFAPTLVKKLIKKDLSPRYIKDEPNVEIISRQDYLKYRENEINKQIDVITGYLDDAKKALGIISYNIQGAKNRIATLQNYITLNTQYRDNEYSQCINATWTYYGFYTNYNYRRYTDEYCLSERNKRDQQNADYKTELATNQSNLSYYQSQYDEYNQYLGQFQDYKAFIESTKDITPYELGLFEPEKSVKVVLDSISDKDISGFLETLTHEYIHYTSYVSEERTLPQFFEEGITDYLARKVIFEQLHKKVNLGYPVIVKIITVMTEKIPIKQFEDIYFNKSSDELQTLLDGTYGKDFYKDTQLYFELIPLSPSDEALKFANNIMLKIGGPQLTLKDLQSTY